MKLGLVVDPCTDRDLKLTPRAALEGADRREADAGYTMLGRRSPSAHARAMEACGAPQRGN